MHLEIWVYSIHYTDRGQIQHQLKRYGQNSAFSNSRGGVFTIENDHPYPQIYSWYAERLILRRTSNLKFWSKWSRAEICLYNHIFQTLNWRLVKNDVSTSVIIMPATTTTTTPPIIQNKREIRGLLKAQAQRTKGQCMLAYVAIVHNCFLE